MLIICSIYGSSAKTPWCILIGLVPASALDLPPKMRELDLATPPEFPDPLWRRGIPVALKIPSSQPLASKAGTHTSQTKQAKSCTGHARDDDNPQYLPAVHTVAKEAGLFQQRHHHTLVWGLRGGQQQSPGRTQQHHDKDHDVGVATGILQCSNRFL